MSKRNKFVEMTPESEALKFFREQSRLSLRNLAELMNMSFSRVHQMETGREDIPKDYIDKFLREVGVTKGQWNRKTVLHNKKVKAKNDTQTFQNNFLECLDILKRLDKSKLKTVKAILESFCQ